ncbi:MAG: hypothetical protein PHQ43_00900 [Dehalococcoidales bacterium]|nr:hypothetical protein [Dehalococcoidales bacterium]
MIKELCEYIEDNSSFTVGTTLFAISVDPDVDTCIVVEEPAPGLADGLLTDKRNIPLVVYARAATKFTARDNAYVVFNLLHGATQISLEAIGSGPVYVCNVECRTPYYVGLDETGRQHVFAMPVEVTVTNML